MSQVKHVRGISTALEMWIKLKEVHEQTGDFQIITLITSLMTKQLLSTNKLDKHLELYSDTQQLLDENEEKVTIFLPEGFSSIRSAIRTMKTTPSLDEVKLMIREDERGPK
uniref:Uncharacterized protein n=1 Tax=Strigamia maritima TaxID=126957 RepID=T1JHD3_STRMM